MTTCRGIDGNAAHILNTPAFAHMLGCFLTNATQPHPLNWIALSLNSVRTSSMLFFIILFVFACPIVVLCSCLGCWLSAHKPGLGKWLLATTVALATICSGFAYLSTLDPGPVSHYLHDSCAAFIVNWIMARSHRLWSLLLVWV